VVEHLPNKHEALSSISNTFKNQNKTTQTKIILKEKYQKFHEATKDPKCSK
jgi:hypothetical protein